MCRERAATTGELAKDKSKIPNQKSQIKNPKSKIGHLKSYVASESPTFLPSCLCVTFLSHLRHKAEKT